MRAWLNWPVYRAREVRLTSAWGKRMRPTTMERQLRVKETAARRALAAAAARRQLEWSFRVTAHKPGAAMMASEPDVQLVLLPPREGRPRARFTLAGDTVVWGAEAMQGRSGVTVTYDGSAIAKRALVTAARLAREDGLNILIPADEQAPAHEREATDVLAALGVPAWFLPLAPGDIRAVAHAVRANRSTVLVLASDSALLGDDPIDRLIAEVGVPVLLVRPGRE